jgi:capsular exopolysaccharide synthesis family protein
LAREIGMSGSSAYSLAPSDLRFRDLLDIFGRRKWLILVHVLVGLIGAFLLSYFSTPKFEAEAQIQIDGRTQTSPGVAGTDFVSQLLNPQEDIDIQSEVERLRSAEVYTSTLNRLGRGIPTSSKQIGSEFPLVKVEQAQNSKVVLITVQDNTAEDTRDFAETFPRVYKELVDQRQTERVTKAIEIVNEEIARTNKDLNEVTRKIAEFNKLKQIASAREEGALRSTGQRNAELQLSEAKAELEGLRASLVVQQNQLASIPKTRTDTQTETNRQQVENEKKQLQALQQQRESLLARFQSDHPEVQALDKAIQKQESFMQELEKNASVTITRPNPEYDAQNEKVRATTAAIQQAEARVAAFTTTLAEKQESVEDFTSGLEDSFKLENRQNELQQAQQLNNQNLNRLKLMGNEFESSVRILSPRVLAEQTKPRWQINIIIGIALGLIVGVFVAIAREISLDKVNYPAEAIGIAGADVLARIPIRPRNRPPLIEDPQSARAFEAYRLLRAGTVLRLQQVGDGGAFMVSSTEKGEGKTVVAGNLAVAMALEGRETLLIDCNLRDPKVHKLFKIENEKGLTNVLLRELSPEQACLDTKFPNLKVMTAGTDLANPTEALASTEMLGLIEHLKGLFDTVILDGPDAFSVADAQEITRHVKNVLFVTELGATNKTRMEQALAFLRNAQGRLLGLAINKDPKAKGRIS